MIDNKTYYFNYNQKRTFRALLSHISLYILFLAIHKKNCVYKYIHCLYIFYRTFAVVVDVEGKNINSMYSDFIKFCFRSEVFFFAFAAHNEKN